MVMKSSYNAMRGVVWDLREYLYPYEENESIKKSMDVVIKHLEKEISRIEAASRLSN